MGEAHGENGIVVGSNIEGAICLNSSPAPNEEDKHN
jgi:hypothetical protein